MGRVKANLRKRGGHSAQSMKRALELVTAGMSIRQASKECNLKYPTVRLYVHKYNVNPHARLTPNYEVNMIFTLEEEEKIVEYIKYCAEIFYGLTTKDCRRVAYQMGKANNIKLPASWIKSEMAGFEWLRSFRKRHPEVSLRKPEACSLARASAFNKHNIESFFHNLKSVMERHPTFADGTRIYNLDETSTTTVQRPSKVLAPKRTNVSKITSGERGTLVTTCCIVSATGQALPPAMVFPRKKFQPHMLHGAPSGTLGLAAASGWMNAEIFVDVMKHFIKHVSASKENPALLIMDNHESHLSLEALDLAKTSGVTVLTLHPHTTAKLQPLDVGLNGPFKSYYNAAVDSWLLRNPGQCLTIYNIAECVGVAYMKAMTPINIVNSFRKTGIFPFDQFIFTEVDFMPSTVTDRSHTLEDIENREDEKTPSPSLLDNVDPELQFTFNEDKDITSPGIVRPEAPSASKIIENNNPTLDSPDDSVSLKRLNNDSADAENDSNKPDLSNSKVNLQIQSPTVKIIQPCETLPPTPSTSRNIIAPLEFMPPIKAKPRNPKRRRTPGRSMIATDTPEKDCIAAKKNKANKKLIKKVKQDLFTQNTPKKTGKNKNKPNIASNSETSEEEEFIASGSSSGGEEYYVSENEFEYGEIVLDGNFLPLTRDPREEEYVVVLFPFKKSSVYYVAKILEALKEDDEDFDYFVSFLRLKSRAHQTFCEPLEPDTAGIQTKDIMYILPNPKITGSSRRQASFSFNVHFDMAALNLR